MDDRLRVVVAELIVKVLQALDDAYMCSSQSTVVPGRLLPSPHRAAHSPL